MGFLVAIRTFGETKPQAFRAGKKTSLVHVVVLGHIYIPLHTYIIYYDIFKCISWYIYSIFTFNLHTYTVYIYTYIFIHIREVVLSLVYGLFKPIDGNDVSIQISIYNQLIMPLGWGCFVFPSLLLSQTKLISTRWKESWQIPAFQLHAMWIQNRIPPLGKPTSMIRIQQKLLEDIDNDFTIYVYRYTSNSVS